MRGYTADGIEVRSTVFSIFTLGQPPAVVQVAAVGEGVEAIRVVYIDPHTHTIREILDELEIAEKREIYAYAQKLDLRRAQAGPLVWEGETYEIPPFYFDQNRIAAAAFRLAEARRVNLTVEWTHAPILAATEVYRKVLSNYSYDELFNPAGADPDQPPISARESFAREMRNLGVLSYQWLVRWNGRFPVVGQKVSENSFFISPVQEFRTPRPLRDLGIKVIHSGFMDLAAAEAVHQQRVDAWKAHLQRDIDITLADYDRDVILIRNRARAEAQREMILNLSDLLRTNSYSEEALAMHLFQALEKVAADPGARQFLPADTIGMLRTFRQMLNVDAEL